MSQAGILNRNVPTPGEILFIEGDSGGPVAPNGSDVIFLVGGPNVTVDGNPGTHTLTINAGGISYTATTTDATPTLIALVGVLADSSVTINCNFTAIQDDASTAIGGTAFIVGRNDGTAHLVGGTGGHQSVIDNSSGFPGVSFGVSGSDIEIFVIGVAATTYNWRMLVSTLSS